VLKWELRLIQELFDKTGDRLASRLRTDLADLETRLQG